jgi:hypothetical protein
MLAISVFAPAGSGRPHVRRGVRAGGGVQQAAAQEAGHVPQQPAPRPDLQQRQPGHRLQHEQGLGHPLGARRQDLQVPQESK